MSDGNVGIIDQTDAGSANTKEVDTAELTRADATVVERQRVSLGDDFIATAMARVSTGRELLVNAEILHEMLVEMRKTNLLLSLLVGEEV